MKTGCAVRRFMAMSCVALPILLAGCGRTPGEDSSASTLAEFREIAERLTGGSNPYLGSGTMRETREKLAAVPPGSGEATRLELRLAQELLRAGDTDAALSAAERAIAGVDMGEATRAVAFLHRVRGLIHLRRAEVQNCIQRHNPSCCIFPLRGGGVHDLRGPALLARDDYLAALAIDPGNLTVRWLVNIVSMALGEYPDGVPDAFLVPPSAFRSEYDVGRFPDIAPRLGLDTFDLCGGAILEDFDGDGLLDVVTSTYDPNGPLHYSRNTGTGTFEDVSEASGLTAQLGGLNCLAADYDNDGRRDILVLRGAWLHDDGQIRNSLLRNLPDGTFADVSRSAGLAWPAAPTQAAAWADFDNDGDLDLYVANESRREVGPPPGDYPSQLFLNEGDGTFSEIAHQAGVTNDRYGKGVAVGDYDNDGDADLYVSNSGPNRLYRNDGGLRFVDVAAPAGVTAPEGRSFAAWFFDYDNDGWLDLFVAAYEATLDHIAGDLVGLPRGGKTPRLYRNRGDGSFEDVSSRTGLDGIWLPMGANFGDLDNDGWLDIYLGTGEPDFRTLVPNVMLRNDGGLRFQDVTESGGFGHLQKGHGIAFGDIDNDGDQDVLHQLGGFYPGDRFRNALFHNPGHGNRFVVVELEGRRSNRDGMGARIRVVVENDEGTREIHRSVGSVSSFGGSPIRQEIGLGAAGRIRLLEVAWPASGERNEVHDVPLDAAIRVVEGVEGYERLALPPIEL